MPDGQSSPPGTTPNSSQAGSAAGAPTASPADLPDDGGPDARLSVAVAGLLTARRRAAPNPGDAQATATVLAALVTARVFAAVQAEATGEHVAGATGLWAESSAQMSLLTLVGSAGGRALPVFLDPGAAVAFRSGARPVARSGQEVAEAALADGCVAVLLDPPGLALPVTGDALAALAEGRVAVLGTSLASRYVSTGLRAPTQVDPVLLERAATALADEPVRAARVLEGPDGLVLGVVPRHPLGAADLAALAARVLPRLELPALDLAVVPPSGPGAVVPLRRRSGQPPGPPPGVPRGLRGRLGRLRPGR